MKGEDSNDNEKGNENEDGHKNINPCNPHANNTSPHVYNGHNCRQ